MLNVTPTQYNSITARDIAAIIRQALKEAWPGVKFSVRKSDYSAVYVTYEGAKNHYQGPTYHELKAFLDLFQGGGFDGMTDSTYYHSMSWDGQPVGWHVVYVFGQDEHGSMGYGQFGRGMAANDSPTRSRVGRVVNRNYR